MQRVMRITFLGTFAIAVASTACAEWYFDEQEFLEAMGPAYNYQNFNTWVFGSPLSGQEEWTAPVEGGFVWSARADADGGLFSIPSGLSTSNANAIVITGGVASGTDGFTAFGGYFGQTDVFGQYVESSIRFEIEGETYSFQGPPKPIFLGWVDNIELHSFLLYNNIIAQGYWGFPAIDAFYLGGVPEPSTSLTMTSLAASLLIWRRRRKSPVSRRGSDHH